MGIRSLQALAVVAAISGALAPLHVDAAKPAPETRPLGLKVKPVVKPLINQQVVVMLQLAADPVALHQEAAGRRLERAEKEQIKAQLRADQQGLQSNIQGAGGTVLANYQASYNGIKVRVAADKVAQLAALPGVVAVRTMRPVHHDNTVGIPAIGAPLAWQNLGLRGEHVKVAIIDTGIDYTHANFGGPGTPAAYTAAKAAGTGTADPHLFGPNAPRVKGGIDLVGDDYNADPNADDYQPVPHPDSNPLDCEGHGSHVAGTAAGSGVTSDGATYKGAYNTSTVAAHQWNVGPGVAPKADLYAIRVFGCTGSTDVVVDAIEWAVDNDMDVINMSLGSDFGLKNSPDAEAATNAARAGVVVVASAGNAGPGQYIVGAPSVASGAISVAANDAGKSFPGATLAVAGGPTLTVINANGAPFSDGTQYSVAVLRTAYPAGTVSLGCSQADYDAYPGGAKALAGKLVVTVRGTCSRVARAIYAQQNGASAALMINTSTDFPPYEGKITNSVETGDYTVTIPFFGAKSTDRAAVVAADTKTVTAANAVLDNPAYLAIASFSSAGPRSIDSFLKPDITAPGVSVVSTAIGTGTAGTTLSGTSMAAPHVTGVAALTVQAHPKWNVASIMASIINTGDPDQVTGYQTRQAGTGFVQPAKSTLTQVTARADDHRFPVTANFGYQELLRDFRERKTIRLENHGNTPATFYVSQVKATTLTAHTVSLDRSVVTVHPHSSAEVGFTLNATAPLDDQADINGPQFHEVAGLIQFTPVNGGDNSGVSLRVPYYLVPRSVSDLDTRLGRFSGKLPTAVASVSNRRGLVAGNADFYVWGLKDPSETGRLANDIRSVGVQSFPFPNGDGTFDQYLAFAVNTYDRWSNASSVEFHVLIDVNNDGVPDYMVVGADQGAITTGVATGQLGAFVATLPDNVIVSENFLATAPTDSTVAILPILVSQLCEAGHPCLNATNPRFTYTAETIDLSSGKVDMVKGSAKFNAFSGAISFGGGGYVQALAPRGTDNSVSVQIDPAEAKLTRPKGVMVVNLDNKSGEQAELIDVDAGR